MPLRRTEHLPIITSMVEKLLNAPERRSPSGEKLSNREEPVKYRRVSAKTKRYTGDFHVPIKPLQGA